VKVVPGAKDGAIDINLAPIILKAGQKEHPAVAELVKCKLAAHVRIFQACPSDILILGDVHSPEMEALPAPAGPPVAENLSSKNH